MSELGKGPITNSKMSGAGYGVGTLRAKTDNNTARKKAIPTNKLGVQMGGKARKTNEHEANHFHQCFKTRERGRTFLEGVKVKAQEEMK